MMAGRLRPAPPLALAYLSLAFVAGIYLGSFFSPPWPLLFFALLPVALGLALPRARRSWPVLASLCLVALFAGMLRLNAGRSAFAEQGISLYAGQGQVTVRGTVADDPQVRGAAAVFRLSAREVRTGAGWNDIAGEVLVRVRAYPEFYYGDLLEATGVLQALEEETQPGSVESYLSGGAQATMLYPRLTRLQSQPVGSPPLLWLHSARERLAQALARALPEPQAALAQAVLLGKRDAIPPELNRAFSRTGTTHLLAISGMNLSIVAGMLVAFAAWAIGRRRFAYVWLAMAGVWGYAALTGLAPPVLRAAIMASVFLLATYVGRQGSASTALFLAAAIMVGVQPPVLWSASFQLSFVAMLGLTFLSPPLRDLGARALLRAVERHPILNGLATLAVDLVAVTLGATLATAPLVAHYFGIVSPVSLPASFLLVPAMPFIILTSALAAVAGLLSAALASVLGLAAWLPITYMASVVELFDSAPFASFRMPSAPFWPFLAYYAALSAAAWWSSKRLPGGTAGVRRMSWATGRPVLERVARWAVLPLLVAAIIAWGAVLGLPDGRLHVSVLDVGNGDAILVEAPSGQRILIDGGPEAGALAREFGRRLPFWDRNISLVALTHPHADHVTGLVAALGRYRVGQALDGVESWDSATYQEWRRAIGDKGVARTLAEAGQTIGLGGGVRLTVLHPARGAAQGLADVDDLGMVLRLDYGEVSFLFTADIGRSAELDLLERRVLLRSSVLKVAHHGSATSTSDRFLSVVRPAVAVVSVGTANPYDHPDAGVMERLRQSLGESVYLTSESGTVEFVSDGHAVEIRTER